MKTTINQRLKILIKKKEIDAPVLYSHLGVSRSIWSGWINQGKSISVPNIQKILDYFPDVSARWFLTGEGEMLNDPSHTTQATSPYDHICTPDCVAEKKILYRQIEDLIDDKQRLKADNDRLRQEGDSSPGEQAKGSVERRRSAG